MLALGFVGLALFAYFNAQAGTLPAWASAEPDRIFPYFIAHVFPVGLTGLVIAAILAASISSVDSALNALTSTAMIDFVERLYYRRNADVASGAASNQQNRRDVLASRLTTLVLGLIGITASLQVSRLGSLLEISNKIINSFAGPILGIYLLGMFTRRATSLGVLVGGTVGAVITVATAFQAELTVLANSVLGTEFDSKVAVSFLWPSTFGLFVTSTVGYLTSLLTSHTGRGHSREWTWAGVVRESNGDQ
jgi:Na+/proline symporter